MELENSWLQLSYLTALVVGTGDLNVNLPRICSFVGKAELQVTYVSAHEKSKTAKCIP